MFNIKKYSMGCAIAVSVMVHAVILAIKFAAPPAPRWTPPSPVVMAVLINTQSKIAPKKASVIAQANLDGGGEIEARGWMPSSPFEKGPTSVKIGSKKVDGEQEKEVEALEKEIAKLLVQTKIKTLLVDQGQEEKKKKQEISESEKLSMELAGRIDKQVQIYASRPKKAFVGLQATQSDLAVWVEAWQRRVESMGSAFYPEQAQGKVRGTLILTAAIRSNGLIESIKIEQSSGHQLLDAAAQRILKLAAPFEPFDAVMSNKVDLVYITRQWRFGPDGLERLESTLGG